MFMHKPLVPSPANMLRSLSAALLLSLGVVGHAQATDFLGTDLRARGEVTFVRFDDASSQAYVITVADLGGRGLSRILRAAHYLQEGASAGQVIRLTVNSTGLVSVLTGEDNSS